MRAVASVARRRVWKPSSTTISFRQLLYALAHHGHGCRGRSGEEAGIPGQHRQHDLSYELEPNGQGTRVVENRHAENGVSAYSSLSVNALSPAKLKTAPEKAAPEQ